MLEEVKKKQYQNKVDEVTPTHSLWKNMGKAFLVGGIICTIGQAIIQM